MARAEAAKRAPYKQEPFCTVDGKEVKETFQFRVLGFRADCTMQAGPALEHAAGCVVEARWPVAWVRRQIGVGAASNFVSNRTAPKALFACEVHRDKSLGKQLETQGKKLLRVAMGISPGESQLLPRDLCLYADKAWVPWSMECSLRRDRLHKSLKASGSTTWPGVVYAKGGMRVGEPIVVFAKKAPPGKNSGKAARWVRKRKREVVAKIGKSIKPDSVREWAAAAAWSETPSEVLPHNFRRWRAGLFDISKNKVVGVHPQHKKGTLCGQQGDKATAVHYFLKCSHHEVVEHRQNMVDEFQVALTDPEAEPMHKVWDGSTQSHRIRSMVCAIPSINPKRFGGCVESLIFLNTNPSQVSSCSTHCQGLIQPKRGISGRGRRSAPGSQLP